MASFLARSQESSTIPYCADNLEKAQAGVDTCIEKLGKNLKKLDKFYNTHTMYNDGMIQKLLGKDVDVRDTLKWYARLELGKKILQCIKENGVCYYDAEM